MHNSSYTVPTKKQRKTNVWSKSIIHNAEIHIPPLQMAMLARKSKPLPSCNVWMSYDEVNSFTWVRPGEGGRPTKGGS